MKRGIIFTILLSVACVHQSVAETYGSYEYTVDDGEVTITYVLFDTTEIVIPEEIGGLPVTTIADSAFRSCASLTSVFIPANVTTIGTHAFYNCKSLTEFIVDEGNSSYSSLEGVAFDKNKTILLWFPAGRSGDYTIPSSVTTIGHGAFRWCANLTSVTIPDSVTTIGGWAFWECVNITSVTIPDSVNAIGDNAFYECSSLDRVIIGNGVSSIGTYAFYYCPNLTEFIVDEGNSTFSTLDGVLFDKSQTTLVRVPEGRGGKYTIPRSVKSIGERAFQHNWRLTSVTIPDSVTFIGDRAFQDCQKLTNVDIPDSVTSIGEYTFSFCGLTSVVIPDSVTTIGKQAFEFCDLTSVVIPKSVTTIGDMAFYECYNLTSVYFMGGEPAVVDEDAFYLDFCCEDDWEKYELKNVIYYVEGTPGWGATFGSSPTWRTAPFTPWGKYVPIESEYGTHADTGKWLGILEVTNNPWVWCDSTSCWYNIPEQTADAGNGWLYPSNHDNLLISQIPGTNWVYSFALDKWLYITAEGWVYLM